MSTRSQQPKRREGLRNHMLSSSPRYGDMKISNPIPHPLPGQETDTLFNPDTKSHSSASLESLSQPARSSLRSSSQHVPNRTPQSTRNGGIGTHAAQDSISSNISGTPVTHRRRGSTLKTVMRKIFGRKRRSDGDDDDFILENPDDPTQLARPQWSPDSQEARAERASALNVDRANSRSHRSTSLPSQRISTKSGPHGSNFPTAEPSPNPDASDAAFLDDPKRHRRATLPSMVLSTHEAKELASRIAQDSSVAESVRSLPKERTSLDGPVNKPSLRDRRRSRSAYGLREAAQAHRMSPIQWRRRSAEIKYWRTSTLKMSETPSIAAPPETQNTMDVTAEEPDARDASNFDNANTQNSSFDLGAFMGNMQGDQDIHLAQRVATLEVKLMDLEFAISKLQGQNIQSLSSSSFGNSVKKAPISSNKGEPDDDVSPIPGSGPFVSSFSSTPTGTPPQTSYYPEERHDSVSTLRPHTSAHYLSPPPPLPPSPYLSSSDFSGISVEQYSALTTLVRREQSARKLLEGQLLQMQKEMQQLLPNKSGQRLSINNGTFLYPSSPTSPGPSSFWRGSPQTGRGQGLSDSRNENYSQRSDPNAHSRQASRNQMPGMI